MRVALIHPPDGILPIVPCASIPVLTGVLRAAGHEVRAYDAGLQVARETLVSAELLGWYAQLGAKAAELERLPARDAAQNAELHRLHHLLATPRELLEACDDSLAALRTRERFLDPEQFNRAFDAVRACFRLAYSVHPDGFYNARRVGHDVLSAPEPGLPDPPYEVFARLADRVLADDPEVIGLTVPFDSGIYFGLKLASLLKQRAPEVPIVMGGAAIDSHSYPIQSDPYYFQVLDYVMIGEGEVQFPRLLEALATGADPSTVNNLRWLKDDGTIGATEMVLVTDLNAVPPPDFTVLDNEHYLLPDPIATIQTSRGCYYGKCTFCSELFRKGFRIRRPDLVVEDMVRIYEQTGIRHFQLWDSLAPPKTLKKLAQEVQRRGLPFEWMAETKFERPYRDEELIRTLAEGGCRFLQFGFESGSSRVLDLIDKGNDLDDVDQTLRHMKKHGIRAGLSWFIGFPGETEHEADVTYDFVGTRRDRVLLSSYARVFDLGTDTILYEKQERFGVETYYKSEGVLDYRYRDGTPRWDTEERDHQFFVRGDFYLLMNSVQLHWSKVPQEVGLRITGQYRCGPLVRQIPPEALATARFVRTPESHVREFAAKPGHEAEGPYGVGFHSITGLAVDLDRDALALVRALSVPRTFQELVRESGVEPGRAEKLLEQAVNRGIARALVAESVLQWLPEADLAAKAKAEVA